MNHREHIDVVACRYDNWSVREAIRGFGNFDLASAEDAADLPDTAFQRGLIELDACIGGREHVGARSLRDVWSDPRTFDTDRWWLIENLLSDEEFGELVNDPDVQAQGTSYFSAFEIERLWHKRFPED